MRYSINVSRLLMVSPSTSTMTSRWLLWSVMLGTLLVIGPRKSEGAVTETSASNKPPFSFACGTQTGGGTPTFCNAGDKKYVQVESVAIFRDYSNEVGKCLEPEKEYIASLLIDWFNYDCKLSNVERDEENKRMPIDMLKEAMATHCGIANAGVTRIVVNYDCVRELSDVKDRTVRPLRNTTLTIPTRTAVVTGQTVPTRATPSTATPSTPRAPSSTPTRTAEIGKPNVLSTNSPIDRPATTTSSGTDDISTGLWIGIGFAALFLLLLIFVPLFIFCFWLPSHREKRKQGAPAELGAPRTSTLYLLPGTYKNTGGSGDDLSTAAYGVSAVENEYALSTGGAVGRRSLDRSAIAASSVADELDYGVTGDQLQSRLSRSSGPPSITYGNLGGVISSVDSQSNAGGYSLAAGLGGGGSRRSSADPDASGGAGSGNGFYDRRLSDRRLIVARHPSESSIRSGLGVSSTAPVESRKLSRTSYAELPSDRRTSSSSSGGEVRKISLSLGTADERRLSSDPGYDPTAIPAGRRPTTYGGPGMPHIDERFEAAVAASAAKEGSAAADGDLASFGVGGGFYAGSEARGSISEDVFYGGNSATTGRAMSLDASGSLRPAIDDIRGGKAGRQSWGGETEAEVNYSFWPPEWQRWLHNRPSDI